MPLTTTTQLRYVNAFMATWRLSIQAMSTLLKVDENTLVELAAGNGSLPEACHEVLRDLYTRLPDERWEPIREVVTSELALGRADAFWDYAEDLWEMRTLEEGFAVDWDDQAVADILGV